MYPYNGGNGYNQWSNPGVGMLGGHQQQHGFGSGSGHNQRGNSFGQYSGGGSRYSQNKGKLTYVICGKLMFLKIKFKKYMEWKYIRLFLNIIL